MVCLGHAFTPSTQHGTRHIVVVQLTEAIEDPVAERRLYQGHSQALTSAQRTSFPALRSPDDGGRSALLSAETTGEMLVLSLSPILSPADKNPGRKLKGVPQDTLFHSVLGY